MVLPKLPLTIASCVAFLLAFGSLAHAQSDYEKDLDGTWKFKTDPNNLGESGQWFRKNIDAQGWDDMEVPGNWDLHNEYAHYVGKGWYTKSFSLPSEWGSKAVILSFEGVYHDCTVWLNGKKLGENNSGFLPFEFDISALIDREGENTLTVCADNTFKRGAIWNWGGVRRPVKLVAYDGIRITRQHITPTINLENKEAEVGIRIFLENLASEETLVSGELSLSSKSGFRRMLPFSTSIPSIGRQEVFVSTLIRKSDFHLWHFDDPFLYESEVTLHGISHVPIRNSFGLRKLEIDPENYQMRLNGESVRLMGVNLVPDARTTGNTLPLWQIQKDVDLIKSLNGNFARLSHLPLPEEMLEYLDQRGMLIVSEIPLWGYDPLADPNNQVPFDWLKRLVELQYNHPSIVGWSTGNEIGYYPGAREYVEKSVDYVRQLDSTRFVTNVTYTAQFEDDYIRFTDLGMLNKYGANLAPVTRQQHKMHPDKVMFYSEYGIGQFGESLDATFEIGTLIDSLRNLPYLIGASIWTYNDYRSSYIGTRERSENRSWGVVDAYRRKKNAYYDLRKEHAPLRAMNVAVVNQKATIALQPRSRLDLPAHSVRGYKISYRILGGDRSVLESGFVDVPLLIPGDAVSTHTIEWQSQDPYVLEVSLLSPQLDNVLDTLVYFQPPVKPIQFQAYGGRAEQNSVPAASGGIRVFFDEVPNAVAYKLRYGLGQLNQETTPTRELVADVRGLELDQNYLVQVVAMNSKGESGSDPLKVSTDPREFLPPAVKYVESSNEGFYVAYTTEETDFLYRIRYRGEQGDEKILQSTTPGLMAVRNLVNGRSYSFEVQRVTDNNSFSLWSRSYTVVPDGGLAPTVPKLEAVSRKGQTALLSFVPVSKATTYEAAYRELGAEHWESVRIDRTEAYFFQIDGLKSNRSYEFKLAAINKNGKSIYSQVIRK
ncbi:glycoside hydrolase family 2 TIM barrel-domain containing protein [Lunatimonas salinarum]|uniref:glycoside hydrolase family 2 TIM barrel-domain containing protein n=1 Tax=Lunatimonas salinarum TaxID=1774590 RepID=UPI001AE03B1E|nr:glycoside hydrolase family 2 TIM barrel-domain containing protein [Lunatimonas salinarum]